jgi:hypothetical protein
LEVTGGQQAYRAWLELLSETLTLLDETIDELEEPPLAVI